ncbi:hypothetical protein [Shewanella litoralis]|uniref:Lipoprotein n=1 Tax=Shewanella litoralis TaxID=2282700 RepID=A0ABQ2RBC6_9GAMM|nr:hypothetical protein [Shewanella litoralis]GGQ20668.1 hypothetical protein GCM10009411_21100 [Shewanella litoralis]
MLNIKPISLVTLLLLFFISACEQSPEDGSKPKLSPEQVSLGFFQAIYIDKDVQKAKQFVAADIQEVMDHYHIASAVQRHVLGLSMSQVTMSIDEIDIDFFRKFTDDVTVVVKMEGLKGGRKWIDDRTIRLHKRGSSWVIVEILPEKGRIEG